MPKVTGFQLQVRLDDGTWTGISRVIPDILVDGTNTIEVKFILTATDLNGTPVLIDGVDLDEPVLVPAIPEGPDIFIRVRRSIATNKTPG